MNINPGREPRMLHIFRGCLFTLLNLPRLIVSRPTNPHSIGLQIAGQCLLETSEHRRAALYLFSKAITDKGNAYLSLPVIYKFIDSCSDIDIAIEAIERASAHIGMDNQMNYYLGKSYSLLADMECAIAAWSRVEDNRYDDWMHRVMEELQAFPELIPEFERRSSGGVGK